MVWPSIRALVALPSTVTERRSSAPSFAITVLSSRRSMPPPERFRALMVTRPASRRSATPRRTATSYVAVIARLVRWTEPGTIAEAGAVAAAGDAADSGGTASGRVVASSIGVASLF